MFWHLCNSFAKHVVVGGCFKISGDGGRCTASGHLAKEPQESSSYLHKSLPQAKGWGCCPGISSFCVCWASARGNGVGNLWWRGDWTRQDTVVFQHCKTIYVLSKERCFWLHYRLVSWQVLMSRQWKFPMMTQDFYEFAWSIIKETFCYPPVLQEVLDINPKSPKQAHDFVSP